MNQSFSATTLNSFYLWLDHLLLANGQAYRAASSQYLYQPDSTLGTGYVAYSSPFKSFVWDSGVGVPVATTISGSFGVLSQGQSGMMMDYMNGRVILPSSFGTNATISGSYTFKELNLYYANQTQERTVFTDKYYLNSRFARTPARNTPPPYAMVTPCIFITSSVVENESYAFGGIYQTKFHITLNVMAENMGQLEGTLSLLEDSIKSYFPQVEPSDWPLDSFGTFKNGTGYSYDALVALRGAPGNLYEIDSVKTSKVGDGIKIDESIFLGLVDLEIVRARALR